MVRTNVEEPSTSPSTWTSTTTPSARSTRTLRRWVTDAGDDPTDETGEVRWEFLSFHDFRRTWAGSLANDDVDEQVELLWCGWNDLETFLDHYRGEASPQAQRRERDKVGWL